MRVTKTRICIVILTGALLVSSCSLPFTNGARAEAMMRRYVGAQLVKCADSYYYTPYPDLEVPFPHYLYEVKKVSYRVWHHDLTEADKANGLEWNGGVAPQCTIRRQYRLNEGWGQWETCPENTVFSIDYVRGPMRALSFQKRRGQWAVHFGYYAQGASVDLSNPSPPSFTCADVPQ